ncbi:uncharacterized protein LOC142339492 isoform X2 [Convolutriloba macropyga]|uniref:uncharacterized protein LOC142339492 isoform X2 n=1 Tax=Convolutriloba macropyga TaxID=536237 RepID=UPI003F51CAFE
MTSTQPVEGSTCLHGVGENDLKAPSVQFVDNSLYYDKLLDLICVHGLKLQPRNGASVYDIDYLVGWMLEVTVEDSRTGANMAHKMIQFIQPQFQAVSGKETETSNGSILNATFCAAVVTRNVMRSLRKDPFVYMWLSLTSIPPEYDALPVNYPGNPVQLASLDVISINRTGHCSISTKIAQDSPRTTPRSKISESFSIDYIYVESGGLSDLMTFKNCLIIGIVFSVIILGPINAFLLFCLVRRKKEQRKKCQTQQSVISGGSAIYGETLEQSNFYEEIPECVIMEKNRNEIYTVD